MFIASVSFKEFYPEMSLVLSQLLTPLRAPRKVHWQSRALASLCSFLCHRTCALNMHLSGDRPGEGMLTTIGNLTLIRRLCSSQSRSPS